MPVCADTIAVVVVVLRKVTMTGVMERATSRVGRFAGMDTAVAITVGTVAITETAAIFNRRCFTVMKVAVALIGSTMIALSH